MARIVILDRRAERLWTYRAMLKNHEVLDASDITSAVRLILETRPDLVLSDWLQSDGHRLLIELARSPVKKKPPVWLMDDTLEHHVPILTETARKIGAGGFLPRLLTPEEFRRGVLIALARAGVLVAEFGYPPRVAESLANVVSGSPYTPIVTMLGGWVTFNAIIERHGVRTRGDSLERLRDEVIGWGALSETDQIMQAAFYSTGLVNTEKDPVEAALRDMARVILGDTGSSAVSER